MIIFLLGRVDCNRVGGAESLPPAHAASVNGITDDTISVRQLNEEDVYEKDNAINVAKPEFKSAPIKDGI